MQQHISKVFHHIRVRPRLWSAVAIACMLAVILPDHISTVTRVLLSWDVGVISFLTLALFMFIGATPTHMHTRAVAQDDGALAVLAITIIAASATIVAIIIELAGVKHYEPSLRYLHFGLGMVTLLSSWAFIHTSFALHYAHEYYICKRQHTQQPLVFPEQPEPDYWDFLYFSFVIGMTSQTSDVAIVATTMRRLAMLHGIISFFFNTALLALAINAAASTL
jgi:uncharacterized membrane protein